MPGNTTRGVIAPAGGSGRIPRDGAGGMKVVVSGGTGYNGRALCKGLLRAGHEVRVTTRDEEAARRRAPSRVELVHPGSPEGWADAVRGCDAVINLAGESIADGRWTPGRKQALQRSRVATTRSLVDACGAIDERPSVFISASAVGYYGPSGNDKLDETAPAGDDFLARLCVAWEDEAGRATELGMRLVVPRIGVVLGDGGGALERMVIPFRMFVGGPIGSGKQWLSWVHRHDVVALLIDALTNDRMQGPVNAVAPDARTMADFSRALGAAMRRPSWIPVPSFALRLALGEMAEMLLTGQRVVPAAAEAAGYRFRYRSLGDALAEILHR